MIYVFLNPLSNNKKGSRAESELKKIFDPAQLKFMDITTINNPCDYLKNLNSDDEIIIAGGDGTLTRFANDIYDLKLQNKIYLYPCGSGNDFRNDVQDFIDKEKNLIPLNQFIQSLPEVYVNGIQRRFINGIGFGIDGFCCDEGDRVREKSDKRVNYTIIALKGLLYKYHTCNATITVDGVAKSYQKVWLAPSMLGRFYGGGMMITPKQNRLNEEKLLTSAVAYNASKFKIICVFPKIFKGNHISHNEILDFRTGHEISVEFDRPQALQIDGETIQNVTSYVVKFNKE